jgi:hypothetical protein
MRNFVVSALVASSLASCGGDPSSAEHLGTSSSAVQGAATDPTHLFAVAVVNTDSGGLKLCSGVLLAPNLVATGRACVSSASGSLLVDCMSTGFGATVAPTSVSITNDTMPGSSDASTYVGVSSIVVPTGSDHTLVCGNDIALLILSSSITLPQYVVPTIHPGMTDPQYQTTVTAIGYGNANPSTVPTAPTRRIRENIPLKCIPNDAQFVDCFSDPSAKQVLTSAEFISGDSACPGDEGSGAFEQGNFDKGRWIAFGIASRSGTSADGTTCIEPVYTRFDAWGSLLITAAQQAAALGNYAVPSWATGAAPSSSGAGSSSSGGSAQGGVGGSSSGAGSSGGGPAPQESSADGGGSPAAKSAAAGTSSGCALAARSGASPVPWSGVAGWLGALVALAGRRRRRGAVLVSTGRRSCTRPEGADSSPSPRRHSWRSPRAAVLRWQRP